MERITPIGFKINKSSFDKIPNADIYEIADRFNTYHKGKYVIGYDSAYCEQSHYHIHFWSSKKVTKGALKTFRQDVLKLHYKSLAKGDKLYLGQEIEYNDENSYCWEGYALKETIINISGYTDEEKKNIETHSGVQLGIKKLKKVKSDSIADADKKKKQFKDGLFEYLETQYRSFINDHWEELKDTLLLENKSDLCDTDYRILGYMIVNYLMDNDKYGSIMKIHISRYLKEYLGKHKKKSCIEIYNYFVK